MPWRQRARWWALIPLALTTNAARAQPVPGSLRPPVSPACISSPFGPRRLVGAHAALFHNGIDFPAPAGAWVHAAAAGTVIAVRRNGSSGLEIDVLHPSPEPGAAGYLTRYAHLGVVAPAVADGRRGIPAGGVLGRVGRTGITYGTHVHFELHLGAKPVDPEPFFQVRRCGSNDAKPPD